MKKEELEKRKKLICDLLKEDMYVPMKEKELAVLLRVEKEDRELLRFVLDSLLEEGKIEITKKGKYRLPEQTNATNKNGSDKNTMEGVFTSHSKGFGFVTVDGREEDLFIPESMVNGALHNDTVLVELLPGQRGKRQEAEVKKIINRGFTKIVGTYERSKNFGFVIPDNNRFTSDIFVPHERSKGAVDGHKVVVELTSYGSENKSPEGKIVEILGHINDPGVDIMSIVKGYDMPTEFGVKVMNQVERVPEEILEADLNGRMDLRDMEMVTIDGEDAKDLDDAVSCTKEGEFYKLGVHIADVSNYVQEYSALDREALNRATSVYLVDRVIPMLPHKLSNGICSLNEKVDRLALSCLMTINDKGVVVDYEIAETVICVNRRMTYTAVKQILTDKDPVVTEEYKEFVPMFLRMEELAHILREKRKKRGSIDFDFPESKIILDKEGHPVDIKAYDRNVATKLIEDFMLIANETVAQDFFWKELPFVYRTHDNPDPEKIQKLSTFIRNFGYTIKVTGDEVHPKEIQKLIAKIEGTPEEALIGRLSLRSMKQAKYTPECTGHFGLACEYYCHFTSPIRRYPDLQIHRIIKEQLRGRLREDRVNHYHEILPEVCKQSSAMERRAEEAERETNKLKKAEYMEERIGESYDGVISGVTSWGVYVELPNTIEGMVHVSKLPGDYFVYEESAYEMVGQETGMRYKLGQQVRITVNGVDKLTRTIDFIIAEDESEK